MHIEAKISPQLRFEVFKRDAFTCQDCGRTTPNVVLYVGYKISPEKGGTTELDNLITRCYECFEEKPLERLSERREQLEMMIEWKNGWKTYKEDSRDHVVEYIHSKIEGYTLKTKAKQNVANALKKYGVPKVLDIIDEAAEKSLKYDSEDNLIKDSVEEFVNNIHKFLYVDSQPPIRQKMLYVCGICNNRFQYWNRQKGLELLEDYASALRKHGYSEAALIKDFDEEVIPNTKRCNNWSEWSGLIEDWTRQISTWDDKPKKEAEQKSNFSDFDIEMQTGMDESQTDAGIAILVKLYECAHKYEEFRSYSLEYNIKETIHGFLNDEKKLYEQLGHIPDPNDKSLISEYVESFDFYEYFSNDFEAEDGDTRLSGNTEYFIAEVYAPAILGTILENFFFPACRYDYDSSIKALDKLIEIYGKDLLPY